MKDDSTCRKNILCQFEVSCDLKAALIEICVNCGKKVIYYKDQDGNLDDQKYFRDHLRYTIQPGGRTDKLFKQIYGEKPIKNLKESVTRSGKKDTRTVDELRRDIANRIKRQYL